MCGAARVDWPLAEVYCCWRCCLERTYAQLVIFVCLCTSICLQHAFKLLRSEHISVITTSCALMSNQAGYAVIPSCGEAIWDAFAAT